MNQILEQLGTYGIVPVVVLQVLFAMADLPAQR